MLAIRFRDILMKIAQFACSWGGNVPNNRQFFDSERMPQNRHFGIFRLILIRSQRNFTIMCACTFEAVVLSFGMLDLTMCLFSDIMCFRARASRIFLLIRNRYYV